MNLNHLQKNIWTLVLGAIAILFAVQDKSPFWIFAWFYYVGLRAVLNRAVSLRFLRILQYTIWGAVLIISGLIFYTNHYLPHAPRYLTGEIACQNDDRGPCGPEYKEDLRGLNIPAWAKFFKGNEGVAVWIALLFAGIMLHAKNQLLVQKRRNGFEG